MALLHDQATRANIRRRIESLTPETPRQWGKMSIDQMLWHVNEGLSMSLGKITPAPFKTPLPKFLMKFLVINVPWPRGSPTVPEIAAKKGAQYDFAAERARLLALVDEFAAKDINGQWAPSPGFGAMTGKESSTLAAKHLTHHLNQFGV